MSYERTMDQTTKDQLNHSETETDGETEQTWLNVNYNCMGINNERDTMSWKCSDCSRKSKRRRLN